MKVTKYLAIALGLVAILAAIAWFLRDTIIQRISGPILQEYGVAVTDVSLDALATSNATISYLELEHENGTTIAIDELTLPIGKSPTGIKTFTAEKVTIVVPAAGDAEPLAMAQLIEQMLAQPENLPNTEVAVAEFSMAPYPLVRDLRWVLTDTRQTLTASIDSIELSAETLRADDAIYIGEISFRQTFGITAEQSITVAIRQTDTGISLSGASVLDLPTSFSIAKSIAVSFGVTPARIEVNTGAAKLQIHAEISYDANRTPSIDAVISPSAPLQFTYASTPDDVTLVSLRSASPIKLNAMYSETQWSADQQQASLLISYGQWSEIPVAISDLACKTGPSCFMNIDVAMDDADLPLGTANRLELSTAQDIEFRDDGLRIHVHPNAELSLIDASSPNVEFARLHARLMSAATLELTDIGWQLEAESIDADIESLSSDDNLMFTAPVSLRNIVVSESNRPLSVTAILDSPSGEATWNDLGITLPGFKGDFSLQGEDVTIALTTVGLHNDPSIQVQHKLDANTGQLSITNAALSFYSQKLSERVEHWNSDWDISAGTFSGELQLNWEQPASDWQLNGQSQIEVAGLAGFYGDTAFVGLATSIEATFDIETGVTVEPAKIAVALIDAGLPVENISADYILTPDVLSVDVENLRMTAFGGVIRADPFSYQLESEHNSLLLRAESIELTELLTLKEFEAIELTGSIGAELPVTIEGNAISIADGHLTGEAPGGVIRYLPGLVPDDSGTSSIDLVTRALSNFEYETLTSTVDYSKDGDLKLQMQLTGRNPDMEDNRPIVLNLGVENNIPKMLKSLQAARAVEEILERRLQK